MKVYYNGSCNICNAEINHYKKKLSNIDYVDISKNLDKNISHLTKKKLFRRMHIFNEGKLISGSESFLILWSKFKYWKILSKILCLPLLRQMWFLLYEVVAIVLYIKNRSKL
jgi:predicted DCC family thiol-disulfide oxidoreductase YuxK